MPDIRAEDLVKAHEWVLSNLLSQLLALKAQEFAREREAREDDTDLHR